MPRKKNFENMGDVLNSGANVMQRRGWHRGEYEKFPGGPVCLFGAIDAAVNGDAEDDCILSNGVGKLTRFLGMPPTDWNDGGEGTAKSATSKKQVVDMMRLAAWVFDDEPAESFVIL